MLSNVAEGTAPQIELRNAGVSYNGKRVVNGLCLDIEQGEVVALLGCNGAGKSSTLKALLNFINIDSGTACIQGQPCTSHQARAPLAFIPEKFTAPYFYTGQQFIDFTFSAHGLPPCRDRVAAYCELLHFNTNSLKHSIRSYSKGMTQKLGLIAVLALDKPLYIFDEPMSGLDPQARAQLRKVFTQLRQAGKTVFFCSHMLTDVEAVCDRIAILHCGHLVFTGSPQQCKKQFHADSLDQAFLLATN